MRPSFFFGLTTVVCNVDVVRALFILFISRRRLRLVFGVFHEATRRERLIVMRIRQIDASLNEIED